MRPPIPPPPTPSPFQRLSIQSPSVCAHDGRSVFRSAGLSPALGSAQPLRAVEAQRGLLRQACWAGPQGHTPAGPPPSSGARPWPCLQPGAGHWKVTGRGPSPGPHSAWGKARSWAGTVPTPGSCPWAEPCASHTCWTGACRPHVPSRGVGRAAPWAEPQGRRERLGRA